MIPRQIEGNPKKPPLNNPNESWIESEDKMAVNFIDWLLENRENKILVKVCKLYTAKIAKDNCTYCGPLWQGLHDIEHDETFVQYFGILLQGMWT